MTAQSIKEALERIQDQIADLQGEHEVMVGPFDASKWKIEVGVSDLQALVATFQPDGERRQAIARILEPQAWAALGIGDTLAYKNRRTSSLRKADRILASGLVQDEVGIRAEPTDAQVRSACLSFRHDYGLLPKDKREDLKFEAREWLHAWQKEGFAAIRSDRDGGKG